MVILSEGTILNMLSISHLASSVTVSHSGDGYCGGGGCQGTCCGGGGCQGRVSGDSAAEGGCQGTGAAEGEGVRGRVLQLDTGGFQGMNL